MFLVYKTDVNHSYASRDLIALASTQVTAVLLCSEHAHKEGENLSEDEDQMHNLVNIKQTQGYSGEGEYQYEEVILDILI